MTVYTLVASPIGALLITADDPDAGLTGLYTAGHGRTAHPSWERDDRGFADARAQLDAYFSGRLRRFGLPLAPHGTPFQRAVWDALLQIPYGETSGYGELAARIGRPGAARAVGMANGRNPISIVVPCHRVVGAGGALTGYAGGLDAKRFLLDLERRTAAVPA